MDNLPASASVRPLVSVIIPARNEEASLGQCLRSLVAQAGVTYEIIVVNDASADRTHAIAESFARTAGLQSATPGVQVIDAGALPPGWHGKAHACQKGADVSRGDWLLFTDADTVHRPGSLARALAEAQSHGASLLSYSPEQEVHGILERALMPLIFAELAGAYPPVEVSDPKSLVAAANGQYLLITREAYEAAGRHAAVAADLLEDVALARRVKCSGRRLFFRFGGDAVKTRMYRSFSQMHEGWSKNLALLFPDTTGLARRRILEFIGTVGALVATVNAGRQRKPKLAITTAVLSAPLWVRLYSRVRKAHFDPLSTAIAPFGLPLFTYLLMRSRICQEKGTITWKGRKYAGSSVKELDRGYKQI